jgi:hypothetical protein
MEGFADGSVTDPQSIPAGMPCFQIKLNNNTSFAILEAAGATQCYDGGAMVYLDGVVARFDGQGFVRIYLDLAQIDPEQLYALGTDITGGEGSYADFKAENPDFEWNKDDYIPATIALLPSEGNEDLLTGTFWNADLSLMENKGTFPTEYEHPELEAPKTLADIDTIVGSIGDLIGTWDPSPAEGNLVEGVFTVDLTDADEGIEGQFKFCNHEAGWALQCGPTAAVSADDAALDFVYELTQSGDAPTISFNFEAGKKYTITYTYDADEGASCVIAEAD